MIETVFAILGMRIFLDYPNPNGYLSFLILLKYISISIDSSLLLLSFLFIILMLFVFYLLDKLVTYIYFYLFYFFDAYTFKRLD